MGTVNRQNKPLRLLILIVAVMVVFWSFFQEKRPQELAGQLEFRMITGIQNGNFQIIMTETADRFFVLDSAFKQSFENNDAELISRKEQLELLSRYQDLQYRAGFSAGENNQKKELRLSREHFNLLTFSKALEVKIHSKIQDSLISISDIQ